MTGNKELTINGYTTWGKKDFKCPVTIESGEITFHANFEKYEIPDEGLQDLIVHDYTSMSLHLVHLPFNYNPATALMFDGDSLKSVMDGNHSILFEYIISSYDIQAQYKMIEFSFGELDYFIPSSFSIKKEKDLTLRLEHVDYYSEEFEYKGKKFTLLLQSDGAVNIKSDKDANARTESKLLIKANDYFSVDEIISLIKRIKNLFAFLCNRQNISIDEVKISEENGLNNRGLPRTSVVYLYNEFEEDFEEERIIKKTIKFSNIQSNFGKLIKLVMDNDIPSGNIHESNRKRRIFDLGHCVGIIATFEYYARKWLPDMISEETRGDYLQAKNILNDSVSGENASRRRKNNFESIGKFLSKPSIPLSSKIIKTFKGYDSWTGLNSCVEEDLETVKIFAEEANKWRNELAHANNIYSPNLKSVEAIKFVEKINYCIVLRECGYCDEKIKNIVDIILG